VIGLVSNSVGEQLYYSKLYLLTADLFAWSLAVVVMSFAFEKVFIILAASAVRWLRRLG
jgi:NitT/TauT family transport system permease protein